MKLTFLKSIKIQNIDMEPIYSVDTVTNYIIDYYNKNNKGINNLVLQKLLYFIQAEFLTKHNRKCFNEDILAWNIGPIIPEVYNKYRKYGSTIILRKESSTTQCLTKKDKDIIDYVLNKLKRLSFTELTNRCYKTKPWEMCYNKYSLNPCKISNKIIKEYF